MKGKTAQLTVKRLAIEKLQPHPKNPRNHPEPGTPRWEAMRKSLEHSFFDPLVWNRTNGQLISGHFRKKVLEASGFTHVDCVVVDFDEDTHVARMIAANQHVGQDDEDGIRELMRSLEGKIDNDLTGLTPKEVAYWLKTVEEKPKEETLMDVPDTLPGAHALKMDMQFEKDGKFDIPPFKENMLAECPENIATWAGPNVSVPSEFYFYNVGQDSVRGLDFSKTIVGFYADDHRFESAWSEPDLYTAKLLNRAPMAVVSPNFSLWYDMPRAVKIWNTYRSRWVGRYFQEAGLKVIPDVNFSDQASFDFCLDGIPKHAPCISIQIQTAEKTPDEIAGKRQALKIIIAKLEPKSVLIYCGTKWEEITEGIFPKTLKTILLKSRLLTIKAAMDQKPKEKEIKRS